jgi:pimeloyl-ACP methyl ester carboxylesterase
LQQANAQAGAAGASERPRSRKSIGAYAVATDYGTNAYNRFFPGITPNQAKVVANGTYPLNLKHPEAKKLTNLESGAAYTDEAYKRPTHLTDAGQVYIEKIRPADGGLAYDVIAVAGSNDLGDWRKNLVAWPRQTESFGYVHAGFNDAYNSLRPVIEKELDPKVPLALFGHSLGGAISTQLGIELKRQGYDIRIASTIGMPPAGGKGFVDMAAALPGVHVANETDPVAYASPYSLVPGTRTLNRQGQEVPHRGFLSLARPDVGLMAHSIPRYQESIHNHLLEHPERTPPPSRPGTPLGAAGAPRGEPAVPPAPGESPPA